MFINSCAKNENYKGTSLFDQNGLFACQIEKFCLPKIGEKRDGKAMGWKEHQRMSMISWIDEVLSVIYDYGARSHGGGLVRLNLGCVSVSNLGLICINNT